MDLADVPDPIEKYETMSRCAREAEQAGYDAIFLYDHFHTVPEPRLEACFEGQYYQVRGAINEPKSVQKPHPPIWIGGAGEKVTLKLVAQYGDACNFNADVATVKHKLDVLRQHCDTVGRDYDSILKTVEFYTMLGDKREIDRVVADHARRTGQAGA